jgi:hypothetical protein
MIMNENMKTYITTKDLTINSLYDEFIKEYTVVMIETAHEDIYLSYQDNKKRPATNDFKRTILVVDRDADFDFINKTVYENLDVVHKIYNSMEETTDMFYNTYIYLLAQTSQYWSDVRYFVHDVRTYLACDAFEYDILQVKVMELVKNKFYDRDVLVEVCLEKNPNESRLDLAYNIIKKQEVDFSLIEPLLMKNQNIKNFYEKLVLKDMLSSELVKNDSSSKINKL